MTGFQHLLSSGGNFMSSPFNVGDVVRLKSGGPKMTVDYIGPRYTPTGDPEARCSWFETNKGKQERKEDYFTLTSLVKVDQAAEENSAFYPGTSIMS
jgi:uncharacterized protein YodC (DUF2158 family)